MGIGTALGDRKDKELHELPKETNTDKNFNITKTVNTANTTKAHSKAKKSRRRPKKMAQPQVQKLFDTCKEVFANGGTGIVPSHEDIERLRAVLDNLEPADVGLSPNMPHFSATGARRSPAITYLHLYECDNFSMGIFCLPPSGVIPLHNHPGMTVFSKLLFGTMHIKSYDWVTDVPGNAPIPVDSSKAPVQHPEVRLAKVKVDANFTAPCNASILYPADGGNMHCFTAITACAVLDVLGPPYCDAEGRHCTYYLDFPFAHFSVDGISLPEEEMEQHAWLQEREKPRDLAVVGAAYRGPKIIEK